MVQGNRLVGWGILTDSQSMSLESSAMQMK